MGCERPAWTGCLIFLWVLMIPGILMVHIALGKLIDPLKSLPDNIETGFNEVLKFNQLEPNSKQIKVTCNTAIKKCMPVVNCAVNVATPQYANKQVDVSAQRTDVLNRFQDSLSIVQQVVNDKYFGVPEFAETATSLNDMLAKIKGMSSTQSCSVTIKEFCSISSNADVILSHMGDVNGQIDTFTKNDKVKQFKDYSSFLVVFHAIPYIGVIALLFFTFFHWKGGICCCATGGNKCACLALFPFALFWLVSFVLFVVIIGGAIGYKVASDEYHLDTFKGNPTIGDMVNHVQTEYKEFWDYTLEKPSGGLSTLLAAAVLKTIINILIFLFTTCECCCKPFKKVDEEAGKDKA